MWSGTVGQLRNASDGHQGIIYPSHRGCVYPLILFYTPNAVPGPLEVLRVLKRAPIGSMLFSAIGGYCSIAYITTVVCIKKHSFWILGRHTPRNPPLTVHVTITSFHINLYAIKSYSRRCWLPPRDSLDTPKFKILKMHWWSLSHPTQTAQSRRLHHLATS